MKGHEYLKEIRLKRGLSLRELDERSGVSYASISRLEAGQYIPGIDTLLKILKALGVPTKDYLKVIGYKEPIKGKCRWGESNPHGVATNGF